MKGYDGINIIIAGCGKVGYAVAHNLAAERGFNVTIVDKDPDIFAKTSESMDVMFIRGNALSAETLIEAGVKKAELVVCAMDADESNLLCGIAAKSLGAKRSIARVRDPEYALDLNNIWKEMGLDMIICPELETAREISRLLRFPTADDIDTFVSGRVEIVSFNVTEARDFFVGKSVANIFFKKSLSVLLAVVERGDTAMIPNGSLVFEDGDIIRVLGRPSDIMNFFTLIGKNTERVKDATIIGGSSITYYLINLLNRHAVGIKTKIIEKDEEQCELLSERFPRSLVIHGDGTDEEVLATEDVAKTEALLCLTNRDEENAIIALYSLSLGIRKVITKINHINPKMVKNLKLGSIVCPKNITADRTMRYARSIKVAGGGSIQTLHKISSGVSDKVEAVELTVNAKARCVGTPLKDMALKKGILVGCIVRGTSIVIPTGESSVLAGDTIIVIGKNGNIFEPDDILA